MIPFRCCCIRKIRTWNLGKTTGLHVKDVKDRHKEEFNSAFLDVLRSGNCNQLFLGWNWVRTFSRTLTLLEDTLSDGSSLCSLATKVGRPASSLKTEMCEAQTSRSIRTQILTQIFVQRGGFLGGGGNNKQDNQSPFLKNRKSRSEKKRRQTAPTYPHFSERFGRFDEPKLQYDGSCAWITWIIGTHALLSPYCLAALFIFYWGGCLQKQQEGWRGQQSSDCHPARSVGGLSWSVPLRIVTNKQIAVISWH